ncbi:MAG: diguanylate cyclase with sensor [Acidimicrobiales bacterium]|nr:diguanylate cyclase with sensor [Acidimicrobiales bacterium]
MASSHGSPLTVGSDPVQAGQVLDALGSAVAVLDHTGRVQTVNTAWARGAEGPIDAISGLRVGDDLLATCRAAARRAPSPVEDHVADGIERVLAGRAPRFELQHEVPAPDGARWFLLVVTPLPGQGAVVARTETTVHHSVHDVFADLAFHDPLTRLPNRWLVLDRLRMALGRSARHRTWATVVFADLDGFKSVNDARGHGAGDQVLTTIGHRFDHALRAEDTCGRWGGDEFVMVLDLDDPAHLPLITARLTAAASRPVELAGGEGEVRVGVSLGVASVREDVAADSLVNLADEAMYEAKQRGEPILCTLGPDGSPHFTAVAAVAR